MGRWSWSNRNTVEDCKSIDIPWLSRHGYFCGFKTGGIEWKNAAGEVISSIGIQVSVDERNFGGVRYWFICPLVINGRPCGRRVGKLYLPPGGKYFGCRHCYNLTYRCQKEHDSRVDALLKNPEMLLSQIKDGDLKGSLLALKAYFKMAGRM